MLPGLLTPVFPEGTTVVPPVEVFVVPAVAPPVVEPDVEPEVEPEVEPDVEPEVEPDVEPDVLVLPVVFVPVAAEVLVAAATDPPAEAATGLFVPPITPKPQSKPNVSKAKPRSPIKPQTHLGQ